MKQQNIAAIIIIAIGLVFTNSINLPAVFAEPPEPNFPIFLPVMLKDYDPSWQWGGTVSVNLSPAPLSDPVMAVDHAGRVHLFWDVWSSPQFIYHTYQTDSGWTNPTKIANTLGISKVMNNPIVSLDGKIHILWQNQLSFGGEKRLMYASFDGVQWSAEEELARVGSSGGLRGLLTTDAQGIVYAVYGASDIFDEHFYIRTRTASGWSAALETTPDDGYQLITWSAFPDQTGGVRLFGLEVISDILDYSYWKSGSFQTSMMKFPNVDYNNTLFMAGDYLHIYRYGSVPIPGSSVTGIIHRCLDNNFNLGMEQVLTGQNDVSYSSKIASADTGRVVFAWKDWDSLQVELSVMDGCGAPSRKTGILMPIAGSIRFGDLQATALSIQPGKFCAITNILYQSGDFGLVCADIYR